MTAIEWATVISAVAAILAVVVPLYTRWSDQRRRLSFSVSELAAQDGYPARVRVVFRNDGTPDINFAKDPYVAIDEPGHKVNVEPTHFSESYQVPWRLSQDDEAEFTIGKSQLADDLRMRECWDSCVVRVVLVDTKGRLYQSHPFTVPVEDWLDADASARKLKPRPEPR